jgi:mannitol-1-/sugar-/sorbitol-6-/2-deoxyglucose-6-phosphatase
MEGAMMIEAVIFDMDGVLLDSEPLWHIAEIAAFADVGIQLTSGMCMETTGLQVDEVVAYRFKQKPWKGRSQINVRDAILRGVEKLVAERAVPLDGSLETLNFIRKKNIPVALASSSPTRLINIVLNKFSIIKKFDVVHSAENEAYGKPHPAVFLTAAKRLHVHPTGCLVFEDSFNGLIAAKAARMRSVVIPAAAEWNEKRFDVADLKLRSLSEFSEKHWNALQL